MEENDVSSDHVIAELIEMGFDFPQVMEAIEAVGPSLDNAVEFILNGARRGSNPSTSNTRTLGKRPMPSSRSSVRMQQPSITRHLQSSSTPKRVKTQGASDVAISSSTMSVPAEQQKVSVSKGHGLEPVISADALPACNVQVQEVGPDWEQNVKSILRKHFGFSSLKSFQKEALQEWLANRDCLVLAATGSGKSLCFQIPALLTGKVVIVISPLISLMHDQCLKLAKHGISACFLGSGQPDSTVEHKAMNGMYGIVYVCPETVLRLIDPLKRLAENRGIALFAIDEVHCVSKWGHDFRPDYRRMSILRETFRACNLKFLMSDIPLMALTATATIRVRKDILESLRMSKETRIVLTSFFRPNLRFQVKHSRTCTKSYENDFHELIECYSGKGTVGQELHNSFVDDSEESDYSSSSDADEISHSDVKNYADNFDENNTKRCIKKNGESSYVEKELSVEYLEDELDVFHGVDDFDVTCGEFCGSSNGNVETISPSETIDLQVKPEVRVELLKGPLGHGPTIIYVPTRKETLSLAKYLCGRGVKAAAYHAKLPKLHLRQVHKEFHQNELQVIVATCAFGMGIDKSNVRRIIHYGWPQCLEAYYQEAGRAGRDGKLADCVLFANLSRIPTLLPNQRSEEQSNQAYKMLSDCFRYGMSTATCRAKTLVEYFGENFDYRKCLLCDVCTNGLPELQNVKEEADVFMRVLASYYAQSAYGDDAYFDDGICRGRSIEKPNFRMLISGIRMQFPKFAATDRLWWQGLARLLEDKGYIREGDDKIRVSLKFPEPTELGLKFLHSGTENPLLVYPEADMLLSLELEKSYSSFSDWGKGWADPEIRRQRLQGSKSRRTKRKRPRRHKPDLKTVRGRLSEKLSMKKR